MVKKIKKLFSSPVFMDPDSTAEKRPWIFLGTPMTGAHYHIDNVDLSSWQAQLSGVKTWFLKPPPECSWWCPGPLETTLYPGDILVLNTNIWQHATQVIGNDLSIVITSEYD